jgi:hypothetical protein
MNVKRAALLRTHRMNIERYQNLLKTKLSEAEVNFLERRLAVVFHFVQPVRGIGDSASLGGDTEFESAGHGGEKSLELLAK